MSGKDNKSSLSHRAQQKFNAGKYVEAVDALEKLAEEMDARQDAKVRHNAAVARFAAGADGADKLQAALRQSLRALEQEFERSRAAAGSSSNSNSNSSSNGADEDAAAASASAPGFSLDQEAAFLRYNYAAALFLGKQYAQASAVLEAVVRNLDPVGDNVAMHVCFLYLDVVLHSCRGGVTAERERAASIRKAQSVLAFLEKPHRFNAVLEPPEHLVQRDAAGNVVETDAQRKSRLDVTEFRFRLHLYRAKFMLLQSSLKAAKKEMKSALELFQKEIKARADGRALEADKTSSAIGHPSAAVQNSTALFLKANLEYLKKNYKKCIKLLASCTQEAVTESVFLNNMGCIHFQMGQRKAAQSYFARALHATSKPAKTDPIVLTNSPYHEVMYNNGLHLLLQGQYTLAFRCFHESSRLFLNRPKLWLRMGECCTAAFAKEQKLAAAAGNKSGLIRGIAGSGAHRRAILPTSLPSAAAASIELPDKRHAANNGALASSADGTPKMSLPFAAKCFKNAVLLCHQLLESAASNGSSSSASAPLVPGVAPVSTADADADTESLGVDALDVVRQKALAQLTYVYLSMYEPHLAITTANELLALPSCSKANSFLARSYAAEALGMLSRAAEATEMLQAERNLIAMADEYAREACVQPSRARAGVHVNNATTLLLQGRSTDAEESVTRAVRENPNCRESLELLVYVLLKKGDTKKALRVLKEAQVTQ